MPKPISLNIKVEEAAVGPVMRLLHRTPGVVDIGLDLGGNGGGKPERRQMARKQGGRALLMQALADGKPHPTADVRKAFDPKRWHNVAYNVVRDGYVRKPTKETMQITEKGKAWLKGD